MSNIIVQGSTKQIHECLKTPIPWILIKNPVDEDPERSIIVVHFSRFGSSFEELVEPFSPNKQLLIYNEFRKLAPGAISEYPEDERSSLKQISFITKAGEAEGYARKANEILRTYFPTIPI